MAPDVDCAFCVQDVLLDEMAKEEIREPDVMVDGTLMCRTHFAEMIEEFKNIGENGGDNQENREGPDNRETQDEEFLQGGVQEDGEVTAFPDKDR